MKSREMTPVEIRSRGLKALAEALGPVGMVRFLQQLDTGSGNYTREREQWLRQATVQQVVEKIKRSQNERAVEDVRRTCETEK